MTPARRKPSPSSPGTDPAPPAGRPPARQPGISRAEALRWWRAGYEAGQASRRARASRRRPMGPARRHLPRSARRRPASQARRPPAGNHRCARQPLYRRPRQPPGLTPARQHHITSKTPPEHAHQSLPNGVQTTWPTTGLRARKRACAVLRGPRAVHGATRPTAVSPVWGVSSHRAGLGRPAVCSRPRAFCISPVSACPATSRAQTRTQSASPGAPRVSVGKHDRPIWQKTAAGACDP